MKRALTLISALALISSISIKAQNLETVRQAVNDVKTQLAPDTRQTVYDIGVDQMADGTIYISGKVSDANIHEAISNKVAAFGENVKNHVVLLPDTLWGIVRVPVACMRTRGSYSSELATQALMGMPVRLLEKDGGWWRIQSPDGYIGWTYGSGFVKQTPEQMAQWRKAPRLVVTTLHQIYAYDSPTANTSRNIVTDLLPGNIVEGSLKNKKNNRIEIKLPDGRTCWADAKAFTPIEKWADQPFSAEVILNQAYAMMGAPYLWGGTSAKSTDCSGLVKISYLANGLILRRDASQQALIGKRMAPDQIEGLQAGDLLFFGETPGGRVTHVAIYDNDKYFIHCAGRVHQSRMTADDSTFGHREYMGATRIQGCEGTEGITQAINHPWYF